MNKMKQTYNAPQSNVINFELCDHLMFLPQSQQGGDQMSAGKAEDAPQGWNVSDWEADEE